MGLLTECIINRTKDLILVGIGVCIGSYNPDILYSFRKEVAERITPQNSYQSRIEIIQELITYKKDNFDRKNIK